MTGWKSKLPNILTWSRVVVIPALIAVFYFDGHLGNQLAALLFLYAGITDFFDGYLARIWQAQSNFGRCLDPIADKLLVATALLLLVHADRAPILPAIAIVCREILVSGLREFLVELRVSVPVSQLAKWKTAVQMVAIFLLLLGPAGPAFLPTFELGVWMLWIAALLTLVTGFAYFKTGWKHF